MKNIICILALLVSSPLWSQETDMSDFRDDEPELLASWLEGTFTTTGNELRPGTESHQSMRFVRFWDDLPDLLWFYFEHTPIDSPDQPLRQWAISIEDQGEYKMLEFYEFADPEKVLGKSIEALNQIVDIDELYLVDGCEIFLSYDGFAVFGGGTVEQYCELYLNNENHVVFRLEVSENGLNWWETGKDEDEKYMWGTQDKPQAFTKN